MRISEMKNHIGGRVMRTFSYEVNHYSKFLALYFDIKPSNKVIEFIKTNGCDIKETDWVEVNDMCRKVVSTKWEVRPNDIAEYEFMGFWEVSGETYKNSVIDGDAKNDKGVIVPIVINDSKMSNHAYYIRPDGVMLDDSWNIYPNASSIGGDSKYDEARNVAYTILHKNYEDINLPTFNELLINNGWILMRKDTEGNWWKTSFDKK